MRTNRNLQKIRVYILPYFLVIYLTCMATPPPTYGQEKQGISVSAGTMAPLQHYLQAGYSFRESGLFPKSSFFKLYFQTGIPSTSYIQFLVRYKVEDGTAKDFLEDNLKGKVGYGAGVEWSYKKWNMNLAYNRVSYEIKDKSAKEFVEALANTNVKDNVTNFVDFFALSDLYDNYLLSPVVNTNQLSISIGYKLYFGKRKSFGIGFDVGTAFTASTSVNIKHDYSSQFAKILLNRITPIITTELEELINWELIPMVGIRFTYAIPIGRSR